MMGRRGKLLGFFVIPICAMAVAACAAGKPIFSIPSNNVRLNLAQVGVAYIDTFITAGCGTRCTPGGGVIIRLQGIDVFEYSHFSANQPFMSAPSGSFVSITG